MEKRGRKISSTKTPNQANMLWLLIMDHEVKWKPILLSLIYLRWIYSSRKEKPWISENTQYIGRNEENMNQKCTTSHEEHDLSLQPWRLLIQKGHKISDNDIYQESVEWCETPSMLHWVIKSQFPATEVFWTGIWQKLNFIDDLRWTSAMFSCSTTPFSLHGYLATISVSLQWALLRLLTFEV